jgi:hypothetical protein
VLLNSRAIAGLTAAELSSLTLVGERRADTVTGMISAETPARGCPFASRLAASDLEVRC